MRHGPWTTRLLSSLPQRWAGSRSSGTCGGAQTRGRASGRRCQVAFKHPIAAIHATVAEWATRVQTLSPMPGCHSWPPPAASHFTLVSRYSTNLRRPAQGISSGSRFVQTCPTPSATNVPPLAVQAAVALSAAFCGVHLSVGAGVVPPSHLHPVNRLQVALDGLAQASLQLCESALLCGSLISYSVLAGTVFGGHMVFAVSTSSLWDTLW